MMNCIECGSPMKTKAETHLYDRGGIRATLHGVSVHRCPKCGYYEVEIPRIEQLNQLLADGFLQKPTRLTGAQIRFLRKFLGWSGADFARNIGVKPPTVSRWEAGTQKMGAIAERLLRLAVSAGTPVYDYSLEDLPSLSGKATGNEEPMRFKQSKNAWQLVA